MFKEKIYRMRVNHIQDLYDIGYESARKILKSMCAKLGKDYINVFDFCNLEGIDIKDFENYMYS